MRQCKPEAVGNLLHQFLRREGIEGPYNNFRIVQAWAEVMGEGIMRYTGNVWVKNQTLHVEIKSPVLRNDLMMGRSNLVPRLNAAAEAQVIADIVFH